MSRCILILFAITMANAQDAMHNFGNLKIHENGAVGFHHDLINNGVTDDNQGTAGFFSDDNIVVSGAFKPIFKDLEIMVANNLFLNIGVGITNNSNFILGDVVTPRNQTDINFEYMHASFYTSEDDLRKIDGYSTLTNKETFTFPIGDKDRLQNLTITAHDVIPKAKSAYFFENPDNPLTLPEFLNDSQKEKNIEGISTYEFWRLDSATPSWVELKWDQESNLSSFIDQFENISIVGWHTENKKWENLGGINRSGDLNSGKISSEIFIPDNYSVITFGGYNAKKVVVTLGNYILTPNNDNQNDFLKFDIISESPNNKLTIFNRWGSLVYSEENYKNTFEGIANVKLVVQRESKLPDGVYFYIINLKDLNIKYQGYLYLIN